MNPFKVDSKLKNCLVPHDADMMPLFISKIDLWEPGITILKQKSQQMLLVCGRSGGSREEPWSSATAPLFLDQNRSPHGRPAEVLHWPKLFSRAALPYLAVPPYLSWIRNWDVPVKKVSIRRMTKQGTWAIQMKR